MLKKYQRKIKNKKRVYTIVFDDGSLLTVANKDIFIFIQDKIDRFGAYYVKKEIDYFFQSDLLD